MGINNETKTGIFVVVCLAVFAAVAVKVGHFSLTDKGYTLKSHFHYTGGIKKHAPVALSGVEVGEVSGMTILYGDETLVELDLRIREGVKIRGDSLALASTYGLMGEKYIEIQAGTAGAEYAKEGDLILSKDSFRMEEMVDIGKNLAKEIEKTVKEFGQTARDVSALSQHLDGVIGGNQKKINKIIDNLEDTSENIRLFSEDIKYHPWKVLMKGKEVSKEDRERNYQVVKSKQNFSS